MIRGELMPKKGKKPGSKPLFGKEKMGARLIVVLTEEHSARMSEAAKKAGKSQSSWARDILLANAPEITET
jgi:hypothetical protein